MSSYKPTVSIVLVVGTSCPLLVHNVIETVAVWRESHYSPKRELTSKASLDCMRNKDRLCARCKQDSANSQQCLKNPAYLVSRTGETSHHSWPSNYRSRSCRRGEYFFLQLEQPALAVSENIAPQGPVVESQGSQIWSSAA